MKNLIKYTTLGSFIFCLSILIIIGPEKMAVFLNSKGVAEYNKGDMQLAIDIYTKSIKMHPNAQVYYNLACAYDSQGRMAQAIEHYKNALSLDANHIEACQALADIYKKQKDFGQAEIYIKKLNVINNKSPDSGVTELKNEQLITLCNEAIIDYQQNKAKQAIDKLKQVLKLDHNFAFAYKILGEIYESQNDLSKAIINYNAAIKAGENDPLIYSNIGLMYMKLENYSKAVEFLQEAYNLEPKNIDIKYNFASVLRDNGQSEEALNLYRQIVLESPQYQNIHNDIAGIYQTMGLNKQATREFEKAKQLALRLKANGDNQPWTALSLAIALNGLNDFQKAKNIVDKLINENPDFSHAYYTRAEILKQLGDSQAAGNDKRKARQLARQIKPIASTSNPSKDKAVVKTQIVPELKNDTIIKLKNGRTMRGKLKKETDTQVVLEMDMGSSIGAITFSKQKIQEIISIDQD